MVVAVVVAATVGAGCAHEAPRVHRIEISGTEAVQSIELRDGKGDPMDCGDECTADVRPGPLYFFVKDREGHQTRARLDVDGPSRVTVTPGNNDARVTGGALFVVGLAAVAIGGTTTVTGAVGRVLDGYCTNGCTEEHDWGQWLIAGGITLTAGLAIGATGLVLWRRYGAAGLSETPAVPPPPPSSAARLRLTPVGGPRWTGLALSGSF